MARKTLIGGVLCVTSSLEYVFTSHATSRALTALGSSGVGLGSRTHFEFTTCRPCRRTSSQGMSSFTP
eukprot:4086100-Pyramimonas_sp.AAC.1